jgi:hypothetical protein
VSDAALPGRVALTNELRDPAHGVWNVAVTVLADVITTVHVLFAPGVQPAKLLRLEPAAGVAVSVTVVPAG